MSNEELNVKKAEAIETTMSDANTEVKEGFFRKAGRFVRNNWKPIVGGTALLIVGGLVGSRICRNNDEDRTVFETSDVFGSNDDEPKCIEGSEEE